MEIREETPVEKAIKEVERLYSGVLGLATKPIHDILNNLDIAVRNECECVEVSKKKEEY